MNASHLRKLVPQLEKVLPGWGDFKVFTAKEAAEDGRFDPPCAFVTGSFGYFTLEITADGELYAGWRDAEDVNVFEEHVGVVKEASPTEMANEVFSLLRNALSAGDAQG